MTYRERATKLIGSYWDSAFTRTGNNKAEMKRAIKRALIDINHTMDEMEELRKLTKSDEFILLINSRINDLSETLHEIERIERME